jgi:hypothetical protein
VLRSAILYHVYSGHVFFTALVLFAIGVAGGRRTRVLPLLAIPLVFLSGTPMSLWLAVPLLLIGVAAWWRSLRWVAIAAALVAAAIELPWHFPPKPMVRPQRLIVLGDSLSSGGFRETKPWPERLDVPAVNLSQPSATAVETAAQISLPPGDAVIVELGGNDMLDRLSPARFESAYDAILAACAPRRTIVLELPIVPGGWAYGAAQRRAVQKHSAVLVPKRVLAKVLADPRNTDDGLHLTDRGHESLARAFKRQLDW